MVVDTWPTAFLVTFSWSAKYSRTFQKSSLSTFRNELFATRQLSLSYHPKICGGVNSICVMNGRRGNDSEPSVAILAQVVAFDTEV